ncbi:DNA translocase FtsK 4TM domain-containing protein, partial [Dankookia rubra]
MPATRVSVSSAPLAGVRRFASPAVKAAIRRRLFEFLGLACGLAGLALLVALASYDAADPSLSTATTRRAANLVGPAGAMLADLLLQGFGWAGALPGVALLAWAWRLATHRGLGLFPARLAALLAAMPVAGAALTLAPLPANLPTAAGAGGAGGSITARALHDSAEALLGPFGGLLSTAALVLAAVLLGIAAFALSPAEWLRLGRAAQKGTVGVAQAGSAGMRGTAGLLGRVAAPVRSLFRFRRNRPVVPGADLSAVLRAADAAAEQRRRPRAEPGAAPPR